jgi:hypothetical protein
MQLKLSSWLLAALAGGVLLAGCGSGGSTTGSRSAPPGPASPGTVTAPGPRPKTPAQAQQAVQTCIHAVQAQRTLPPSVKAKLDTTCQKASSTDRAVLQQAAREICIQLVVASHVPAGLARERALAVCGGGK